MRTVKDPNGQQRVILSCFVEQKQSHRVKKNDGTYATLFMGFTDGSFNGWNFKPTIGTAMTDLDEIKVGDEVLFPYTVFENESMRLNHHDLKMLGMEPEIGVDVYAVEKDLCWMGIRDGKMFCIGDNMICKRVYEPAPESTLTIVSDRKKYETYVYVEQLPEDPSKYEFGGINMSEIKVGDIIGVYKKSDLEFKYVLDNEHKSLIRVNFSRDFLGVINNSLAYEF